MARSPRWRPFRRTLSAARLEKICRRLGQSVKAGIPLTRAWKNEAAFLNGHLRQSFNSVVAAIRSGDSVAASVARQSCFPPLFVEMIRVGEETGHLDQALLRLANHYRNLARMRRTFLQGLTWPVLQLMTAAGVITLFFLIVGWMETRLEFFRAPDIFQLGLSPTGNLLLFWGLISGGCALAYGCTRAAATGWFGQLPMRVALHIPLVGNTLKTFALSRFAWAFGTASAAGMDAKRAIRLGIRSTGNHYYTAHEDQVAATVGQGHEFFTALLQTDAFPDDLLQAVQVGEATGELGESLNELSDDYRDQAELSLRRISQISGFSIFLLTTGTVGFGVVLMYAQYLGTLNEALTNPMSTVQQIDSDEKTSNPVIAAKNEAVKDFIENNEDFKKVKSMYEHLSNINNMTPNEFLDGF